MRSLSETLAVHLEAAAGTGKARVSLGVDEDGNQFEMPVDDTTAWDDDTKKAAAAAAGKWASLWLRAAGGEQVDDELEEVCSEIDKIAADKPMTLSKALEAAVRTWANENLIGSFR